MEKRVALIIVFLFSFLSLNAQYKYKIEYDLTYNSAYSNGSIQLVFGGKTIFLYSDTTITAGNNTINLVDNQSYNFEAFYSFNEKVDSYTSKMTSVLEPDSKYCSSTQSFAYNSGGSTLIAINHFSNSNFCRPYVFGFNDIMNGYFLDLLKNNNDNSEPICFEELLSFKITSYTYNVSFSYAMEYSFDGINWNELLPYARRNDKIGLDLSEIPSIESQSVIHFQARYTENGSTSEEYSDTLTYTLSPCPPKLVPGSISGIATSCSYKADGDFSFAVNRDLNTGERLVVSLFFEDPLNTLVGYSQFSQQDTFDLTDNSNGTYTFNWDNIKKPLDKGQYFVVYQSLDLPDPNAVPGSLKWSTTENFEVNIGSPPPLIFTATPTDVNCNGGNDGSIQLSAKGGGGNYEYFLGDATIGTPFSITGKGTNTNPIIHNITNLPAGTKTIKVQDGYGCVEKN